MALSIKTPTPMAIAFFLILTMVNTAQSQTTSFAYDFRIGMPVGLSYRGDAHFAPETHYLCLTKTDNNSNALPDSVGQAINAALVPFWAPGKVSDFETTIKFIIRRDPNDDRPADGLALFMGSASINWQGLGGGNFGLFDDYRNRTSYLVVEFDIYPNEWDPPYPHVGIDIESRESVATVQISEDYLGEVVTMRVNYGGSTKMISVVVTWGARRYEVSYEYDLTTVLPHTVAVGITATTGAHVAIYDVISCTWPPSSTWKLRNLWPGWETVLLLRRGVRHLPQRVGSGLPSHWNRH